MLSSIPRAQLRSEDLSRQIETEGVELPLEQLGAGTWQLEPDGVTQLMAKIKSRAIPLREFTGAGRFRGVTTGLNSPFLVYPATKNPPCQVGPKEQEIIKPYLRGQD